MPVNNLNKILVVEDNDNDLELTIDALSEYNMANFIDVARDGQEAMDYLHKKGKFEGRENGNPVVILLDLKLPKKSGQEVLDEIKSNEAFKTIPVVILTSSKEESDLVNSYQKGVNAYVVKPVGFHSFVDAVKSLGMFWALINETPHKPLEN
ncbi:MAG TPA: response regulator [Ignavibacteria bacterium]|nr:response regulator [Ignavibacteria bacterium]HAX49825.1 two-component system response regulator [Bacteroidota bacterium]HRE10193.1 response regulator [Ignavibacteria bacterium]HRF65339.1 response regulator [Ignavibacteria bacterium]HRJ03947.1 response regulator [Ignavibacteria bacterium]